MNDLRQAAQQALEALESSRVFVTTREKIKHPEGTEWYDERIEALRAALVEDAMQKFTDVNQELEAALAEPVEPVAWMVYTEGGTSAYVTDNPNDLVGAYRALPLYTSPPQRKPLSEEEIDELAMDEDGLPNSHLEFARAIERAHWITL